ncbi:MAG: hypothetical protein RLZZ217_1547 [Planctomycetota bacterium]
MTMPRPTSTVLGALGLVAVIAAAGCNGPTARGIENRRAANDRFDRAGAQIAYDQAQQSLINGQYKLALDTIDQAIRRFPQDAGYLALRGRIQQEMRQYEGAQRTFEYALTIDPTCHECLYYLGVEAQRRSDDAGALGRYDAAWSLEPSRLQYAAAGVECCLAMDDLEGAEERLCTADQFFGQSAALSALRAELHALQGDEARALQHARQAAVQSGCRVTKRARSSMRARPRCSPATASPRSRSGACSGPATGAGASMRLLSRPVPILPRARTCNACVRDAS